MATDYAAIIKDIRRKLGLTQQAFARELEVVKTTVQMWEMGRKEPSPLSLRNLAKLMQREGLEVGSLPTDAAIPTTPAQPPAPKVTGVPPPEETTIEENLAELPSEDWDTHQHEVAPELLPSEIIIAAAGVSELGLRRERLRAVRERARRKRLLREGKQKGR